MLKSFGSFGLFHTPNFVWAILIIEDFFVYLSYLLLSVGCDPSQG